ncbi:hypothetical protein N0B44_25965 [Roseibacterium beibuensis]|uniref:hypothetical protein n=1 Tax=[Roseibacterium] beibuensis TaxID=1193142 RepID=UPI00217DC96A|nr:hypothetical protein [Roseibacterium beibuensis]MCS6626373.1 hypothetical protein [Roseibacterium beibuensis]
MLAGDDPGARRNRGGGGGIWLINVLVSTLVALLSLYVFRAEDTRRDAHTVIAGVAALPGQVATTPAMAAPAED